MLAFRFVAFFAFVALTTAQNYDYEPAPRPAPPRISSGYSSAPKPTPVAILKQINRHNEDGSYTYGYEGGDGSFKIETKLPTGEVKGKYGYVDDVGKVRVVEYGATKYGFEPSGEGITVAPPTLVDETTNKDGSVKPEYTAEYYDPEPAPVPVRPAPRPKPRPSFDAYSPPQQFAPEPLPQRSPSRVQTSTFDFGSEPRRSFAPAPPPQPKPSFSFSRPAPIEEDNYEPAPPPRPAPKITYAQPAPARQNMFGFDDEPKFARPAPRPSSFSFDDEPRFAPAARPAPQFAPAPAPRPAPRPAPSVRSSGGVLDQLAKDYALPSNSGAPVHDISFGYY